MRNKIENTINNIKEKDKSDPYNIAPLDKEKLPVPVKVLAILCIVQCLFTSPLFYIRLLKFINIIKDGSISQHSTNAIIINIAYLVGIVLTIIALMVLGIYLISNKRRHAAMLMDTTAIVIACTTICGLMLSSINLETAIMTISIIFIIALRSYVDPSLAEERKLQSKLRNMEYKKAYEEGRLGLSKTGKGYAELNYFNIF